MVLTEYDNPEFVFRAATPVTTKTARAPADALLHIDAVDKAFGARTVLRGLQLSLRAGEFVALLGRSGSGKSTLLRLVAGLDAADAGCVLFEGQTVQRDDGEPPPGVRLLAQDETIRPWRRAARHVERGLHVHNAPARARGALAGVGLADRAHDRPAQLSAGERQKVRLAAALVHEPRLLLLDEPFGALDLATRTTLRPLIGELQRAHGFAALMVTHDVHDAIALADRVLLLDAGHIVWDERLRLPSTRDAGDPAVAAAVRRWTGLLLRPPLGA